MDEDKLQSSFETYQVALLKNPEITFDPIHIEKTVINVFSKQVCDTICTLAELDQVVNAWKYDYGSGTCVCAWLTSLTCDWTTIDTPDQNVGLTVVYIQLAKTLHCGRYMNKCLQTCSICS